MALGISFKISAIDDFTKTMNDLDSKTRKMSDMAGQIGAGMATIGAGMALASGAALGVGLNYLAGMEKAEIGLKTLTGSASETERIMQDLQEFAINTPFEFEGMVAGTRRLIGMGFASKDATEMLYATADAVAAAGGGSAELDGVLVALGQIQAKGKVSAEEMNQLAERGIPAWGILAEEMGKTPAELMKMAENGKLLAKDALPALQKGFQDTFGGAAAAQADTFSGRFANLKEQFTIFAGVLAEPIFEPLSNAMGIVIEKIQVFSEWFKKLPEGMQTLITVSLIAVPILTLIAAGILGIVAVIPLITGGLAAIAGAFGVTVSAMLTTVGIIAGVVVAVASIGVALVLAYKKIDWFRSAVDSAWAFIKTVWNNAINMIKQVTDVVMNGVKRIINDILSWVRKFWEQNGEAILSSVKHAYEAVKSTINSVVSAVSNFLNEQLSKVRKFWSENGDQIMNVVNKAYSFIKSFISTYMDSVVATIKMALGIIKGVFEMVWPIISNVVKIAWNVIKTIISTTLDVVMGLIKTVMSLIEGDWEGAWESIKDIGESIWNNIEDFFSSIDLVEIGKDVIRGFIDGIGSMAGAVSDKVESIVDAIPDAVKKLLGIHSPSRVMMALGGYTAEGMALGIGQGLTKIKRMAGSMANAATSGMTGRTLNYGLAQTNAGGSSSRGVVSDGAVTYGNVYITIDAKNVREFNDVVKVMKNARQVNRSR